MSETFDLRTLEAFRPCDLNPHRFSTPAETQRLIDACNEDDARGNADVAAYEARLPVSGGSHLLLDDDAPADTGGLLDALTVACTLVTVLTVGVALRFVWEASPAPVRVVEVLVLLGMAGWWLRRDR